MDPSPFTVLLIGNYENDEQTSMLQFAASLAAGLEKEHIPVRTMRPTAFFGRLWRSPTGVGKWLGYLDKFVLFPKALARELARLRQEGERFVVHICDHSNAHYTRHLGQTPHLVTCNDLLAIRSAVGEFPENRTRWTGRILQSLILRGLQQARHITCISEATRQDLLRISGVAAEKTSVTYMGFNDDFAPVSGPAADALVQTLLASRGAGLGFGRFLLHVGSNAWYKNRTGVIYIYKALTQRMPDLPPLVFAGKPLSADLRLEIKEGGLTGAVVDLGPVSHEELCALYTCAELLLFPSLQEGFGWPIIEAQACGCRVATTRKAPMTEVGGSAAVYFDPAREGEAADSLVSMLRESEDARRARVSSGEENVLRFSAAEMIRRYRQLYEAALESAVSSERPIEV